MKRASTTKGKRIALRWVGQSDSIAKRKNHIPAAAIYNWER